MAVPSETHKNTLIHDEGRASDVKPQITNSKVKYPRYRPTWPRAVQEVKAPRFLDTQHRPPLPPGISWYSFLEAESNPGIWTCQMLRKNPQ